MYFQAAQIAKSILALANVHPFHGITFLACKEARLPIGKSVDFGLDGTTDAFLKKHHRIDPGSPWFFQPFKSSDTTKKWVRPDYAAKGLQAINTQTFISAWIHARGSRNWGWQRTYVDVLAERLPRKKKIQKKIPAFHLAVWLYRDKDWPKGTTSTNVIEKFASEFRLTVEEKRRLFDMSPPLKLAAESVFQTEKPTWAELRKLLPAAPDSKPDQGGTLAYLATRGLGPAGFWEMEPAKRLTLIAGDNGLGKTFLLECAWWALTGIWAGRPAFPIPGKEQKRVEIIFGIEGEQSSGDRTTIAFDRKTSTWPQPKKRPTIPGLIVYARVDGSFAVWDPARQAGLDTATAVRQAVFTSADVWDGLQGRIEGLIRDWIRWQNSPQKSPFATFVKVLAHLSPPDLGVLEPGPPVRIPEDPRDIPTIKHPFGTVPIVYTSAGVRRIVTLAYLIVWAWNEHLVAAEHARTKPQRRMVVLVDEIEAHLHPKWQRSVLPALLSVGEMLSSDLEAQYIVATHSPLVMASSEPVFDLDTDALLHLDLKDDGEVKLDEIDFVKFGDVSAWLTSPVFELRHARSNEAEAAIEEAKALQLKKNPAVEAIRDVSSRLVRYLSPEDKFWPRWMSFAERFGVQL